MRTIVMAIAAAGALSACKPAEADFVSACSDVMKERLYAPETYKVTFAGKIGYKPYTVEWATANFDPNPPEKYRDDILEVQGRLREIAEQNEKAGEQIAEVLIEFEASGRRNDINRSAFSCEMPTPAGGLGAMEEISDYDKSGIRINGKTNSEYRVDRLRS